MITPNDIERLMAEVLSIIGEPELGKMEEQYTNIGLSKEVVEWLSECGVEGISFLSAIGDLPRAGSTLMLAAFYLGFITHKQYGEATHVL